MKTEDMLQAKHTTFTLDLDEGQAPPMAILHLNKDGSVYLSWYPGLFTMPGVLTEELKKTIVEKLRFHANKLESGDLEANMLLVHQGVNQTSN